MRLPMLLCLLLLLPLTALAEKPRLLFDQGHRQAFVIEKEGPLQLSHLAELCRQQGWRVEQTTATLSDETLAGVDALIISGAFSPLDKEEIAAVMRHLDRGGKLAVMIHIGQPLLPLLHKLGVDAGNRVLNEKQNQPQGKTIDFAVTRFAEHPLTTGLNNFFIYGGWPLRAFEPKGTPVASTSPHAWVDMNKDKQLSQEDMVDSFAVIVAGEVGRGSFAVFADDAIFQNQFLRGGNRVLAENLARWLKENRGLQEI